MTTCPECKRTLATIADVRAMAAGDAFDGARCYRVDLGDGLHEYDAYCGRLAADLRAKADAALLAAARCFPPGFVAAVAAVLVEGARVKGCEPWESGGGQSLADHLTHLCGHACRAYEAAGTEGVDEEDLTHAAARAALAWAVRAK